MDFEGWMLWALLIFFVLLGVAFGLLELVAISSVVFGTPIP